MSIVLQGSTSGSITLQEPAVAGSTVLSLPATTGTVLTSASPASDLPSSINGPAFYARSITNQSLNGLATTKLVVNDEIIDTNNNYDISNYRFTPTVAGYYQISGQMSMLSNSSNEVTIALYKNANSYTRLGRTPGNSSGNVYFGNTVVVYMNGTTDYLELYCFTQSSITTEGGFINFSGALVRSA